MLNAGIAIVATPRLTWCVVMCSIEALDDNFVMQAAGESEIPEWPEGTVPAEKADQVDAEFDFDAHIAKLMAKAEGKWTDTANDFDDEDDEDGEDEDGNAGERFDDQLMSTMLRQYDDDEIGYLDDDDPRLTGHAFRTTASAAARGAHAHAGDDDEDEEEEEEYEDEDEDEGDEDDGDDDREEAEHEAGEDEEETEKEPDFEKEGFKQVINQYLKEKEATFEELQLLVGVPKKERPRSKRAAAAEAAAAAGEASASENASEAPKASTAAFSVNISKAVVSIPEEAELEPESGEESNPEDYLPEFWKAKPRGPRHDVETVVSTYTNTENHPKQLRSAVSVTSSRTGFAPRTIDGTGHYGPAIIRLSKKTGLPLGRTRKDAPAPPPATDEASDKSGAEDDHDHEHEHASVAVSLSRQDDESKEAKRARKAAVKAANRERRAVKKEVKQLYKSELQRQTEMMATRLPLAQGTVIK